MAQTESCIIAFDNIFSKQSRSALPIVGDANPSGSFATLDMTEGNACGNYRTSTGKAARAYAYEVEKLIIELGIPPHIKGFLYIREAILMLFEDEVKIYGVTKVLYPEIAREYGTTGVRVERAIRHAIDVSWSKEGNTPIKSFFPNHMKKPSNTEFLAFLFRSIAQQLFS